MKTKIVFIERKLSESISLEIVFRQIEKNLSKKNFDIIFQQLPYFNRVSGIIKNFLTFRRFPADIYHITGDIHYITLCLPRENTILTIHDLRFLHFRKGLRRFILKKLFLDFPVRRLRYITAISEATKNEIVLHTKCAADKIKVIENPLQETIYTNKTKPFNNKCPVILQIGTAPNKNVVNVIKALRGINCIFRLIGELSSEILTQLKFNNINFENNFGLNALEIRNEYEKSDIVVFCSTYEGFGLPIIEAQAMHKPVITSNISPMKEVAGGGAYLVDPENISSIKQGILEIISNENLRKKLVAIGLNNIQRFEPAHIALQYEYIYQEITDKKLQKNNGQQIY